MRLFTCEQTKCYSQCLGSYCPPAVPLTSIPAHVALDG